MSTILLKDLTPGQQYYIQVRADDGSSVSDWSPKFDLLTTSDGTPPDVPTGLSVVVNGDTFVASWTGINRALDQNLDWDHYDVAVTAGATTVVVPVTNTTYTLTFANNRQFFGTPQPSISMKVRSVDASRNASAYTGSVAATNPAPGPVTSLVANAGVDSIDMTWVPPSDLDLIGYNVYTGTTSGFTPSGANKIAFTSNTRITYTTTTYSLQWFKVRAVDVFGQESTDTSVSATPISPFILDTTAPATPTGLAATITTSVSSSLATSAAVSWTANTEPDLAGYFVRYRVNGTTPWNTVRYDKATTSAVISNLTPYVNYDFQIAAVDFSENMSSYSATATGTGTTNSAPSTPTAPTVSVSTMQAQVTVPGTKAAGGAMEADVNYYEVYGSTTTGFTPAAGNMLGQIAVGPAMVQTFQIPAAGSGSTQTWFFKIIAVDNGGLKSSASAQTSGTPGLIQATNITDATITNAKINDLAADKITAGSGIINNLSVKSILTIGDASTTGVIQSFDYSAGTAGFKLGSVGGVASLEINQGSISANALLIQNGSNIYNAKYSDFEVNNAFFSSTNFTTTNVIITQGTSNKYFNTASMAYSPSNTTNSVFLGGSNTDYNFIVQPNTDYIVSFYAMVLSAGPAATLTASVKYQTASSPGTLSLSGQAIPANTTWARYWGTISVPGTAVGGAIMSFSTNTSSGSVFIDGIQVEEKTSARTTPSTWKPPGATSIDGYQIKTGSIISTATTVVNSTTIPVWSIPLNGSASFANLQVRGNAIVGVASSTDGAQSSLASGNYVTGTTGWKIISDGAAEFNSVTVRGTISSGTANRVEVKTVANPFESSSNWGVIQFYADANSGYYPAQIWSNFGSSIQTIAISSPYTTASGSSTAARINLQTDSSGNTVAEMLADSLKLSGETILLNSTNATSYDLNLFNTNVLSVRQSVGANRFQIDLGTVLQATIKSRNGSGTAQRLEINADDIRFNITTGDLLMGGGSNVQGRIEGNSGGASVNFKSDRVIIGTAGFNASTVSSANTMRLDAQDIHSWSGGVTMEDLSGGGATGANIGNGGRVVRTSTKTLKKDIKDMTENEAYSVLGLKSYTFKFRDELDGPDPRRYPGFIAEQGAEVGAELWVGRQHKVEFDEQGNRTITRDKNGKIIYFRTGDITVAHNYILKSHHSRIDELEREVATLKSLLDNRA